MDTFTIYADTGEYQETAEGIGQALSQFRRRRPDCFVAAVVNNGMRPRLMIEGTPAPAGHLALPGGSVLVTRETCGCGQSVTLFRGTWWNDDDSLHDCGDSG